MEKIREMYFKGMGGCGCKEGFMCKQCLGRLEADVRKYENGCGATWEEEFGGLAAGPGEVTC